MRPRIFLRTTEFLWQEGHTCHATEAEARAHAREVLTDVYGAFMTDVLAIPVIQGRKTARERFAGAVNTLTCEAMMGDGKALADGHQPRARPELRSGLQRRIPRRIRTA